MSDAQARDHHTKARMAFDRDGRILALEIDTIAALGAYLSNFAPSIPGNSYPQTVTGLYTTPNLHLRVRGAYTNTVPIDAYRGSGRPEATFVNERLLENGARELGIDVAEIRRRNLIPAESFPYTTPVGRAYDCGDPPALFDKLLAIADYEGLRAEQSRLQATGRPDGDRHRLLPRQVGHRVEPKPRQPGRPPWRLRERHRARPFGRQGDRLRRLAQPRPGPRHHVLPDRRRPPRAPHRRHRPGRGRHRQHPLRQRHLGVALALGRRGGDHAGRRPGDRQGAEARGAHARMRRGGLCCTRTRRSRCAAPTAGSASKTWPMPPIMGRSCRPTARWSPGSRRPCSTSRPTPTTRRRCISPWSWWSRARAR